MAKPANLKKPLSPLEMSEILAEYVKRLQLVRPVMLGQSMGTQTVTHFTARYPEFCSKLILIGPTLNKWERNRLMQSWRLLCDTFIEPWAVNRIVLRDYFRIGIRSYLVTSQYMVDDPIEDTLPSVQSPVLILTGERDGIAPAWHRSLQFSRWTHGTAWC